MKTIGISIALLALGCTNSGVGDLEPRPTTFDRLQERPHFMLQGTDVEATAAISLAGESQPIRLPLATGFLTVAANPAGDLVVDELSLWFKRFKVGTGLPPHGVTLTNVHIYNSQSAVCDHVEWSADNDTCEATTAAPLMFEASMEVTDDMLVTIGPEPIGSMGVDLFFYHEPIPGFTNEALTTDIRALAPGDLVSYKNLFTIGDLALWGSAHEMVLLAQ